MFANTNELSLNGIYPLHTYSPHLLCVAECITVADIPRCSAGTCNTNSGRDIAGRCNGFLPFAQASLTLMIFFDSILQSASLLRVLLYLGVQLLRVRDIAGPRSRWSWPIVSVMRSAWDWGTAVWTTSTNALVRHWMGKRMERKMVRQGTWYYSQIRKNVSSNTFMVLRKEQSMWHRIVG